MCSPTILYFLFAIITCCLCNIEVSSSAQSSQDDLVTNIPLFGPPVERTYAGYLPVRSNGASLFYWFFEKRHSRKLNSNSEQPPPIIVFLNGGPGCSSATGLFDELGPYQFDPNSSSPKLLSNQFSWSNVGHLLFIDQPVGTGFSFVVNETDYTTNEEQVAEDLYRFLIQFYYVKHPEYQKSDLFIFGESYAGKYIPASAYRIVQANNNPSEKSLPLKGIGMGDPLIHPIIQRMIKADQIYGYGLIDKQQREQLQAINQKCIANIQQSTMYPGACVQLAQYLVLASGGVNQYDLRTFEPSTNASRREYYLNLPQVRDAFHAPFSKKPKYVGCDEKVYQYLASDILKSTRDLLPYLQKHMKVYLFAGTDDLQDGPIGHNELFLTLEGENQIKGFREAPRNLWIVDDQVSGYVKETQNFTMVWFFGAGHFLPHDQPKNALDMIFRFITSTPFCSNERVNIQISKMMQYKLKKYGLFTMSESDGRVSCSIAKKLCEESTKNCYNHGQCQSSGYCKCDDGWIGPDCSYRSIKFEETVQESLNQQQWFFISAKPSAEALHGSISFTSSSVKKTATERASSSYRVGEGLGGMQPFHKVCLYGKKGGVGNPFPSFESFDFVLCVHDNEVVSEFVTPVSIESDDPWRFGLFNSQPVPVQFTFKLKQ